CLAEYKRMSETIFMEDPTVRITNNGIRLGTAAYNLPDLLDVRLHTRFGYYERRKLWPWLGLLAMIMVFITLTLQFTKKLPEDPAVFGLLFILYVVVGGALAIGAAVGAFSEIIAPGGVKYSVAIRGPGGWQDAFTSVDRS